MKDNQDKRPSKYDSDLKITDKYNQLSFIDSSNDFISVNNEKREIKKVDQKTLSPLEQLNIILKLKNLVENTNEKNDPQFNSTPNNTNIGIKEFNDEEGIFNSLTNKSNISNIFPNNINEKQIILLNNQAIDLESLKNNKEFDSEYFQRFNNNITNYDKLTNDQKVYYLHNTLKLKENSILIKTNDLNHINKNISQKRKVLKEIQENIFSKEYIKEKSFHDSKLIKDQAEEINSKTNHIDEEINKVENKIKTCVRIIENYNRIENFNTYYSPNKSPQKHKSSKSKLTSKSLSRFGNRSPSPSPPKRLKSGVEKELKIVNIDYIVSELSEEKKRLEEVSKNLLELISKTERNIVHLNDSIQVLEIKNKSNNIS